MSIKIIAMEILSNLKYLQLVFKNKMTGDSYSDVRDFFRHELGEMNEENMVKKLALFNNAKIENIQLSKIVPNQEYLNEEKVNEYRKNMGNKIPLAIKFRDYVVLFDGHHKVAAAILNGDKQMKMKILDGRSNQFIY